ncbi:MAG: cytochrome c [Nitrosomonadales bacterium]|nr:cytochrome c [Nitrosomonadales bacterium]
MKIILTAISVFIWIIGSNAASAEDDKMQMVNHHDMNTMDTRTSLNLSAEMKQHQLTNMRAHVDAIRTIVGFIAENKFAEASKIAHIKLGLTPEMKEMCGMFEDEKFRALGMAFHKSGDDLGKVLQTGDANASLRALNKTMQYCVECHANYRQ